MTDVVLPKQRDVLRGALGRIGQAHVPVRNQFHAIGVGVRGENDNIVQNSHGLGIVARHHLVHKFHQLMCAQNFGSVQSAVNPHHCFAFVGQPPGFIVGESFSQRQFPSYFLVARELLVVLR